MNSRTQLSSPYMHRARTVPWIMRQVLFALLPAVVTSVYIFGFGIVIQLTLAITTAVVCEAFALKLRALPVRDTLCDGSAIVLGCFVALAVPPYAPWWIVILGTGFGMLVAKHAFGGIGQNVFNPAMVGYVFLLLCYPLALSRWPSAELMNYYPGPFTSVTLIFGGVLDGIDAVSGATALDHAKTQASLMRMQSEMQNDQVFGVVAGRGWEWVNVGYLVGGLWLIWRRVIGWRLPIAFLTGIAVTAIVFYLGDPELHRGVFFHWFAGATMIGAFFIVTDPVSSATTPRGMLVFGALTGVLTYLIREFGGFPDGVALSIVMMNACAPLIDRLTQPRLYGKPEQSNDATDPTRR